MQDETRVPSWEDLFFAPELPDEVSSEAIQEAYGRTVAGLKAIVDSYNAPVGLTPKEVVWSLNKARLYRYQPVKPAGERYPVPLLLVYALINKPFIFDLVPGRSFVEYLLEQGFDVFLLDWGAPGLEDKDIRFDDYVTEYLRRAVRKMLRVSGAQEFSMLGYCLGATLATVYAALYPEAPLRNLILLTAPLDFSGPPEGSMALWLDEKNLDVDKLIGAFGNVPGELIRFWAKLLKPVENFVGAYVNLWKQVDDSTAVQGWQAINRWVEDVVPVAGAAFHQFVVEYVRGNRLVTGRLEIKGRTVDLGNIKAALLNVIAQYDHLVAPSQSQSIVERVSSQDKELRIIPSTHVGVMASARAQYKLWPELVAWLSQRSN